MKSLLPVLTIVALALTACAPKKNKIASTPLSAACLSGQVYCDSSVYNNNYGYQAYPVNFYQYGGYNNYYYNYWWPNYQNYYGSYYNNYSYGYNNYNNYYNNYNSSQYYGYFCDCPVGSRPVYNAQMGMGCVQDQVFGAVAPYASYFYLQANSNNLVNITQVPSVGGSVTGGTCQNNIAQSCAVDLANTCGAGMRCQVTSGSSRIGICVRQ